MPDEARSLEEEANAFALRLMERLALIVPTGDLGFTSEAVVRRDGSALMTVASANLGGIVLTIEDEPRLQLEVNYELVVSSNSGRARVLNSMILVRPFAVSRPLFTVDYVRDARSNTPAAHYNLHFGHDAITDELLRTGKKRRGALHRRSAEAGKPPLLRDLHFPVGGHRFRPCLEDVLEMLSIEFGIDVRPTAAGAIREGRREWRKVQLRAAVSDDPESAVEELRELGYTVEWSPSNPAARPTSIRADRTHAI